MKSITSTITGLASSLFLNVGLAQVAAKLDPIADYGIHVANNGSAALATTTCVPCHYSPRAK